MYLLNAAPKAGSLFVIVLEMKRIYEGVFSKTLPNETPTGE
jgi:hypothetical protein